jgi:L-alanine-DL-glutamate epimerase-like enolase superfamily enzyme
MIGAFTPLENLTAAERGKVKITGIKLKPVSKLSHTLIRIDTDAGISGYGESGVSGPMMIAWREQYAPMLINRDPISIQRHFHRMTTQMHPYMANIPALSGIDMALWDLAGKLTGRPIYELLGGPFRDTVPMFINSSPDKMLDRAFVRDWAANLKKNPLGFRAVKINTTSAMNKPAGHYLTTLSAQDLSKIRIGFENVREELGPDYDIMVHCHNEYDLPSSIGIAQAVESIDPKWLEDPLPVHFSDSWVSLKRNCRVPLLTGEKLGMPSQYYPFLKNQAVDFIYPDIAFCGGITAAVKIATLAELYRIPVATHNVGGILLTMASIHFGLSIHDFLTSETRLGDRHNDLFSVLNMANNPPVIKDGQAEKPELPGLGVELNDNGVKKWQNPGDSPKWM